MWAKVYRYHEQSFQQIFQELAKELSDETNQRPVAMSACIVRSSKKMPRNANVNDTRDNTETGDDIDFVVFDQTSAADAMTSGGHIKSECKTRTKVRLSHADKREEGKTEKGYIRKQYGFLRDYYHMSRGPDEKHGS